MFDGPRGKETLADLFDGRSQLIIYHFMLGPGWEEGCVGCSFVADHLEGGLVHLEHHDVTVVVVSRAPLAEIEAFKRRMDWRFKWVSSYGSDFNFDYHVSFRKENADNGKVYYNYEMQDFAIEELPGLSVFIKDETATSSTLLDLCARRGDAADDLYVPRPHAEGAQRDRSQPQPDRLGAPP